MTDFSNLLGITVGLPGFDGNALAPFGPATGTLQSGTSYDICNDMPSRCPAFYGLADYGELLFDSVGQTATAEITVGSPVPEPETWVMVGTGLLGAAGVLRRRWGR